MLRLSVALLLAGLSLGAWSDPPSPSSGNEHGGPPQQPPCEHTNTPYDYEYGTPCRPFVVKIENTPQAQSNAAEGQPSKPEEAPKDWWSWEWITAFSTLGLVVVGAITVAFLMCQTRMMKSAVEDGATAAKAATRQAHLAEETFKSTRRPYLYISNIRGLERDQSIHNSLSAYVRYTVTNGGQVPAIIDSIATGLSDFGDGEAPDAGIEDWDHPLFVNPILQPGEIRKHLKVVTPWNFRFSGSLDPPSPTAIEDGDDVWLRIVIKYHGPFSVGHEISLCRRLDHDTRCFVTYGNASDQECNYET